jgi:branched-chain amino acid transport system ATP-binding protein
MLELRDLSKRFAGFLAVGGVSLTVDARRKHAIIGPNGAGKSTLFNLITGFIRPSAGDVIFKGEKVTGLRPHHLVKRGMGRSFQHTNIYPRLTAYENVQVARLAYHGRSFSLFAPSRKLYEDETLEILELVQLGAEREIVAGELAYGQQKQIELAIALALEPQLLLLDEPTAGMSPIETRATIALIERIVEARDLTLLFTEHDMDVVFSMADVISVMHHGQLIATGAPDEVRDDDEVQRVYLGEADHHAA